MDNQVVAAEAPTTTRQRLVGIDAARGLALIGMFVAHAAPRLGLDPVGQLVLDVSSERSRLLFAVTAGLGLGLLTGGPHPRRGSAPGLRWQIAVRGLCLLVLGSLLTALDPPVRVILDEYGVAFLLMIPLVFLPLRWLLGAGAVGLVLLPGIAAMITAQPEVRAQRLEPWGFVVEWFLTGAYPLLIWVPVLVLGVGLVRLDLTRPRVVLGAGAAGIALAVVGLLTGPLFATPEQVAQGSPVPGVPQLGAGTALIVAGNVGACLAVATGLIALTSFTPDAVRRLAGGILSPVAAAGSMPLTIYTAQVLVLLLIEQRTPALLGGDSWRAVILLTVVALVFGYVWREWLGRGPLERVITALARPRRPARAE